MFFDSPIYVVFLGLTVLIYWRLPHRQQNYFLLIASYFFYGWWDWRFLGLMGLSTCLDYLVARRIEATEAARQRKVLLVFSLAFNFAVLGFFKYFNFFVDTFAQIASAAGLSEVPMVVWKIVLPPAISFYTFQEVAYIVDVYKRKLRASSSLPEYALFVSLFPHLIAGPIQQPSHLLPQVRLIQRESCLRKEGLAEDAVHVVGRAGGQEAVRQSEECFQDLERHLGECLQGLIAVHDLTELRLGEAVDAPFVHVFDDVTDLHTIAGEEVQVAQGPRACGNGSGKRLE